MIIVPMCSGGRLGGRCQSRFDVLCSSTGSEVSRNMSDEPSGEEPRRLEAAAEIRSQHSAGILGLGYRTQ